jgi:hypothetical protein
MKKILLSVSTILMLSTGTIYAQWVRYPSTGTSTGLSFSGGTAVTTNIGAWNAYTPPFSDNACSVGSPAYVGGAGGTTGAPKDSTDEVDYTLAGMVNGYDKYGTPNCYPGSPSFSAGPGGGTNIDLSATANQTMSINIRSTVAYTASLLLQDNNYNAVNYHNPAPSINILGDNAWHTYTINFDTIMINPASAANSVMVIAFVYNSITPISGRVFIKDFAIGSAPAVTPITTGINAAAANISSTKLYPNPTSDQANIELNLVTPSDVKVTLSDVMGREVMTIAQGSMSSITQSFSVANLQKGVYTVNYFVNGAAAKAELLMVK